MTQTLSHKQLYFFFWGLLASIILGLGACSNRYVYESVRQAQIQECERSAEGQARQDCLRGYQMTFEEYEQERKEALGKKEKEEPKLILPTEKKNDT
ncbi:MULTISPECIES: hypothetical protein [Alteromonadaceae]|jgi:hypothetical protein|uniref:Lipoprotein n=1 Tax=Brumicola blandensis TaxID=3075611 RepID=A0AAW8QY47_9ALTE|nr:MULTISPECIES: hypothetical protein [unclassified Alteromonas]MDT0580926.1 hypothetical protein [Alteromonas sp. W409]MDT0629645.1 hypothetical protein [Alteromonas sp. W364]